MLVESSYRKPFPSRFCQHASGQIFPGNTFSVYQIWSRMIIWPSHTCHAKWTWKLDPAQIPSHDPSIESLGLGGGGILCLIDIHPLRLGNIAYTWHYSSWLCFFRLFERSKHIFCMKAWGQIRPIEMPWNIVKWKCRILSIQNHKNQKAQQLRSKITNIQQKIQKQCLALTRFYFAVVST